MNKLCECRECGENYKQTSYKPGPVYLCGDCGADAEVVDHYTGNMIYDHKVGAQVQINADPRLTAYINNATKLRNKGSNLGNNLKVDSSVCKTSGGMRKDAGGRSRRRE